MGFNELAVQLILLFFAAAGFVLGAVYFLKKGKALYMQIAALGMGCAMLGRLFNVAAMLAELHTKAVFNVGLLGVIGSFMFFFTANYKEINSLVDDGSKELRKYRTIAWLAPLCCLALYAPLFFSATNIETKAVCLIVTLFAMETSYFHLKLLIIPDVRHGIARSIRGYNLTALIYSFASVFEFTAYVCRWDIQLHFTYLVLILCMALIMPVLKKGVKSWTI